MLTIFLLAVLICSVQYDFEQAVGVNAFGQKKKTKIRSKSNAKQKDQEIQIEKLGQQKLQEMEKMEAKAKDNVIEFSPSDYMKYVVQNPRPYDVVMIFNVKANCQHCEIVQSEFAQTVYSFV